VEEIGIKDIKRIIDALYASQGINFSEYAFSSFKRRIIRFLDINKIRDLNVLVEQIRTDNIFADNMIKEITVNVTEMFRDPEFWKTIRDAVLPQKKDNNAINIWHAACSSGEEVYSMAILLQEAGLLDHSKIIATDLNKSVLETARRGIYSIKYLETNDRNYELYGGKRKLSDWYKINGNTVEFDRELIRRVEFRSNNLASGCIAGYFDLIICRNVLIYFNSALQERVIHNFSNSLSPDSFLGIGSKESILWCKAFKYFEEESADEKIYKRVAEKKNHNFFRSQENKIRSIPA